MCPLPFTYFVKTTTIVSAASDSNDGRDPLGCGLTNGIFTFSTLNVDRNGTGSAFTGGTDDVVAGDYIYLTFGSGTSVDGLYEVASVTGASNLVLVADAGLIDDSTTVTSSDGPWLTLQYSVDTMATTGQQFVICADGGEGAATDWEPNATLDFDTNQGGLKRLTYRGGNARGVVDGTKAVISGADLAASTNLIYLNAMDNLAFLDLRITGATGDNINANGSVSEAIYFQRCRIDSATGDGIQNEGHYWKFADCEIDGNGGSGYNAPTAGRSNSLMLLRCQVHDNVGSGLYAGGSGITLIGSTVYDNGVDGFRIYRVGASFRVDGCVFFGNTGSGIGFYNSAYSNAPGSVENSVFRSNTAYGISFGGQALELVEVSHCCFSNNTSGSVYGLDSDKRNGDVAYMGLFWDDTNVYTDPLFTSEVDGSEDFTPQAGSPLEDAGIEVHAS